MWLRLVDLRAALAGRTYAQESRFVVRVDDAFCDWNSGTYVLEGGPDGAECNQTTESPDLVIGASELGSIYLGSVRPSVLARAGRVDELTSGALTRADAMFATNHQAWTPLI
jgi:predicted acetyltransferase